MASKRRDYRDVVFQIDSELSKIQDADILLERILTEARKVVNAEAGTIYVKVGELLAFKYTQNITLEKRLPPGQKLPLSNFAIPIDDTRIAGYAAKNKVLVRIDDAYSIPADRPYGFNPSFDKQNDWRTTSVLTVPLVSSAGSLLGVIQVLNALDREDKVVPFTAQDEKIVAHFAVTATNALMRAFYTRAMILRMNQMAELRDPKETGAHVNRVAGYAAEIYDRWAFNRGVPEREKEKTRDTLKMAALLHDVGKVAISDLILKKPARFTPEEYKIMQAHTCFGARLFRDPQSDIDRLSAEVALTHHENWDGTGYPGVVDIFADNPIDSPLELGPDGRARRLVGEEIPLGGRIVAVADVYDALVSRRVYKEAWDSSSVYDEIKKMSGTKFDPEVAKAFFEIIPRIEEIRGRYPDTETEH
ncbi:MAG: HD domain-containing protein [Spirochaetaceae bacterium]|nr:HD domain-containing protein [Spirochaetaceae bacterium]